MTATVKHKERYRLTLVGSHGARPIDASKVMVEHVVKEAKTLQFQQGLTPFAPPSCPRPHPRAQISIPMSAKVLVGEIELVRAKFRIVRRLP